MARRKELRGVAHALLGSFVSRNNDVMGYWGMGKLVRLARESGAQQVEIDLLARTISPAHSDFLLMVDEYARMLANQIHHRRLQDKWVRSAKVAFFPDRHTGWPQLFNIAPMGDRFECAVLIEDDRGTLHTAKTSGRSWPHDPAIESRRHQDSPD